MNSLCRNYRGQKCFQWEFCTFEVTTRICLAHCLKFVEVDKKRTNLRINSSDVPAGIIRESVKNIRLIAQTSNNSSSFSFTFQMAFPKNYLNRNQPNLTVYSVKIKSSLYLSKAFMNGKRKLNFNCSTVEKLALVVIVQ